MTRIFTKKKRPVLEFMGNFILLLSIAAAIIFELSFFPETGLWPLVAKGMPVTLLGLYVAMNIRTLDHGLLALALFASACGDVLLDMPMDDSFQRGMLGFAVAHIFYIVLFIKNRRMGYDVSRIRLNIAAISWAVSTIIAILLFDKMGDLALMVIGYMVILTMMVSSAQISRYPFILVGVGPLLFFLSDGLIAGKMFLSLPEWTGSVIWITYYLAQFLITMGVLIAPDKERRYQVNQF